MTERPIIFNAEMVRAILAGNKTMTRRPIQHVIMKSVERIIPSAAKNKWIGQGNLISDPSGFLNGTPIKLYGGIQYNIHCPYVVGDELWVRESFWGCDLPGYGDIPCVVYDDEWSADGHYHPKEVRSGLSKFGRIPSIHMPRWASRIQLRIISVGVERVQDITEEDAIREGSQTPRDNCQAAWTERDAFRNIWDSIYGNNHPWASNCWTWVIEFEKIKKETGA
jgi:hypothetical protein